MVRNMVGARKICNLGVPPFLMWHVAALWWNDAFMGVLLQNITKNTEIGSLDQLSTRGFQCFDSFFTKKLIFSKKVWKMKVLVFNTSAVSVIHQLLKTRFPSNMGHRSQFSRQNYVKTLAQYLGEMILNVFGSEVYSKVKRLKNNF